MFKSKPLFTTLTASLGFFAGGLTGLASGVSFGNESVVIACYVVFAIVGATMGALLGSRWFTRLSLKANKVQ